MSDGSRALRLIYQTFGAQLSTSVGLIRYGRDPDFLVRVPSYEGRDAHGPLVLQIPGSKNYDKKGNTLTLVELAKNYALDI